MEVHIGVIHTPKEISFETRIKSRGITSIRNGLTRLR